MAYSATMTGKLTMFTAAAALLTGSTDAATKSHPDWMVGQWAWLGLSQGLQPGECPESEFYGRNGYVIDGDSVSRWWIEDSYLVRVTVETIGGEPVGQVYKQRFTRPKPNELIVRGDGWVRKLVRCGDVPREWEYRPGS